MKIKHKLQDQSITGQRTNKLLTKYQVQQTVDYDAHIADEMNSIFPKSRPK